MNRTVLTAFLCASVAAGAAAQARTLRYQVPAGWTAEQPRSSMRLAQFALPKAAGDAENALAVIFFFGQGQGGSVDANLERWAGQMEQANGKPGTVKHGKTAKLTANGLPVAVLDISGAYADSMMGGGPATKRPNYRMKAAVIETPGGAYFVKLTGPARTIARWEASFTAFLQGMKYE